MQTQNVSRESPNQKKAQAYGANVFRGGMWWGKLKNFVEVVME
jgi:hypothetical protein